MPGKRPCHLYRRPNACHPGRHVRKGNSIGVFAIEPKTGVYWATNNKYTYDGRAFKPATEEDNIIVTVGTDLDFYVYYPFKEGQTDITAISHSIGDQQEKSGWLSADFLTASYTDVIQDYTIPLHFEHRLSTVEVRVEGSDRVDGARMENVKYGSRFNLLTGKPLRTRPGEAMPCTGTVPGTSPRYSG